jgi:hypothetical protein
MSGDVAAVGIVFIASFGCLSIVSGINQLGGFFRVSTEYLFKYIQYVFICYGLYVFPCSSRAETTYEKFQLSMLLLDQNFLFYPMVHLSVL